MNIFLIIYGLILIIFQCIVIKFCQKQYTNRCVRFCFTNVDRFRIWSQNLKMSKNSCFLFSSRNEPSPIQNMGSARARARARLGSPWSRAYPGLSVKILFQKTKPIKRHTHFFSLSMKQILKK